MNKIIKIDDIKFRIVSSCKDFNKSIALNIDDFMDLYFHKKIAVEDIKFLLKKEIKAYSKIKLKG